MKQKIDKFTLTERDPTGKVIKTTEFESHSYTLQESQLDAWDKAMRSTTFIGNQVCKDTSNVNKNLQNCTNSAAANWIGSAGDQTKGIVVGTGVVAHNINDYKLGTQILHGNGPGLLSYGVMSFAIAVAGATSASFLAARTFTNNSGGLITITEIGIYELNWVEGNNVTAIFCVVRDLLGTPYPLAAGNSVTVTYQPGVNN